MFPANGFDMLNSRFRIHRHKIPLPMRLDGSRLLPTSKWSGFLDMFQQFLIATFLAGHLRMLSFQFCIGGHETPLPIRGEGSLSCARVTCGPVFYKHAIITDIGISCGTSQNAQLSILHVRPQNPVAHTAR
jgi:hypothetical protein